MGRIFAIKRFEIHDGDGIRTTLFLKGCPLRCKWCHNPEGLQTGGQIGYNELRCVGCGACASLCPAHGMEGGVHRFDRRLCSACGKCARACLGGALTYYGREVSPREILPALLEDRDFFEASGGGVTLSGGEPMLQAEFALELLRRLKAEGVSTALDTSGFAPWAAYERALPHVDQFLFDVKAADSDRHRACTGQPNELILQNLRRLDAAGARIDVRIPLVPGLNDDQIAPIGRILKGLHRVRGIKVLPYHALATSKYRSLGMEYATPEIQPPSAAMLRDAVSILRGMGLNATDHTEDGIGNEAGYSQGTDM